MWTWLRNLWNSPSEQEELVDELNGKIRRLEADYVELARRVIEEAEARKTAERAREALLLQRRPKRPGSNVVSVNFGPH